MRLELTLPMPLLVGPEDEVQVRLAVNGQPFLQTVVPPGIVSGVIVAFENERQTAASTLPWPTVETIAAYIESDGTDEQRLALADAVREGRWAT